MKLTELSLKLSYRTGRDDLVRDFYTPCLQSSALYRRAAGYFSSSGLALAAHGVASLAARNGKMRLVVSPHLEPQDVEALQAATENPVAALRSITARSLADIENALIKDRLNALAWLAASGLLEVKIALRLDSKGGYSRGIYHEKTGIFTDDEGNHVSFSGSSNETAGGLVENFESVKVFCSWKDPEGRVQEEIENFEALWENATPGLRVLGFTDVSRELLERYRDPARPPPGLDKNEVMDASPPRGFHLPQGFDLRPYQKEAIQAWSANKGQGVLSMATGSGKTLTALTLAAKVAEKNRPFVFIVVCPYINLCKQWIREMAPFGLDPVAAFEGRDRWLNLLEEEYQRLGYGFTQELAIVTTNATFMSGVFQAAIRSKISNGAYCHLLVADEVHNLGAQGIKEKLPEGIVLRLGLSATPERHHDPEGTQAVFDYFGKVIYEYPMARAIKEGRLCPYRYFPVVVELTDEEADQYQQISVKLRKFFRKSDSDTELSQGAMLLLIQRARLFASAANKMTALDELLSRLPEKPRKAIFYCGDGQTRDTITDEDRRQIHAVARLLGEKHGLRVRTFTYQESPQEREEILQSLSNGFLDGVVAIRCLDEGIDVPDLQMGFLLASSTNPRQFIQRRGRLLRRAEGKNRAIIYDLIISPPDMGGLEDDDAFNMERSMFKRELSRIVEFCEMAENGSEAMGAISLLRNTYNLVSGGY